MGILERKLAPVPGPPNEPEATGVDFVPAVFFEHGMLSVVILEKGVAAGQGAELLGKGVEERQVRPVAGIAPIDPAGLIPRELKAEGEETASVQGLEVGEGRSAKHPVPVLVVHEGGLR